MFRKGRRALLLTPCFQNIYKEFLFRAQKRERSERQKIESERRGKYNLIKVSKLGFQKLAQMEYFWQFW